MHVSFGLGEGRKQRHVHDEDVILTSAWKTNLFIAKIRLFRMIEIQLRAHDVGSLAGEVMLEVVYVCIVGRRRRCR